VSRALDGPSISKIDPEKGYAGGGTLVRISGAGLKHISVVTFANIKATDLQPSETQVTCKTPPGPEGLVQVIATDDEGNPSGSLDFTYTTK